MRLQMRDLLQPYAGAVLQRVVSIGLHTLCAPWRGLAVQFDD